MRASFEHWDERTFELAVDRFSGGCEDSELDRLQDSVAAEELEELERMLAAVHLASLGELETPPAESMERLARAGREVVRGRRVENVPAPAPEVASTSPGTLRVLTFGGWLAAAALLLVLVSRSPDPARSIDPAAGRLALLSGPTDAGLVVASWTATEDPAAAGASGDVVWSRARQEGYMLFRGLAENDPRTSQYQLWIFDTTRPDWESTPVDGGVFDVAGGGEVVVPIDPKLPVGDTALFAVTVERPGGVVVSDRERIVLTAAPAQ